MAQSPKRQWANPLVCLTASPPADPSEATFHVDFAKPAPGDIILRSSDNIDFYFCPHILIGTSTFFRGVLSLPTPSQDVPKILELPSSTAEGLCFMLSLLAKYFKGCETHLPSVHSLRAPLSAAMPTIETYDMGVVFRLAMAYYYSPEYTMPFTEYVLCILAGDQPRARHAAKESLRYRIFSLQGGEKDMFAFLVQFRPEHAIKMYQLHDPFVTAANDLKEAILASDFDQTVWLKDCVAANAGEGCPTFKLFQGDYATFCKVLATRMTSVFKEVVYTSIEDQMGGVMEVMVECEDCRARMDLAWRNLYMEHFHKVDALCEVGW